jgi:hypothetical protein
MFPHIQNKMKALASINNVLKVDGKFMIAHTLGSKELNEMHRRESSIVSHDSLPSKTEMMKLLKSCGFNIEHFEDNPKSYLCISTKQ